MTPTARRTLDNHIQSETAFQSACVTAVTLTILPSGCYAHLGVLRPLPPGESPTRNLLKISFCGHLGITYLLPIILGVSLLQPFCWLLTIVSQGQPSSMFLQHRAVARWVALDQSSLPQAFLALPAVASWILAAYLVGSLFCSFDQLSPSDDTLDPSFPQHNRAPIRPPPFSVTSAFTKPPRRFIKLHLLPAASLLPMVEPPASAPLHRATVILLASRCPLFPSQSVHFCFSSLISPLSSVGCYVQSVYWGGGGGGGLLFLLLLFTCSRSTSKPLLGSVALLSATFPSPPSCPSPPSLSSAEPRLLK